MMKIVIVGTGFSGSIMAREIVDNFDTDVELIEERNQIGGNMFDYEDQYGIMIQKYGPHFINTDKYWIIEYLSKYAEMVPYDCSLLSFIDGKYVKLPFNFTTMKQLIGPKESEHLMKLMREEFRGCDRVTMDELLNSKQKKVREFAELVYEKAFKTYSSKQWGIPIEKIDVSVINRVKFCIGYDSRYLNKDFQYLPKNGFTDLFKNMLNHDKIHLHLNENAIEHISFENNHIFYNGEKIDLLIFTGEIDRLFSYKFGKLDYRTLEFKHEYHDCDKYLPSEIVSYPQAEGYTRSTEYKWFSFNCSNKDKTVVVTEYPHKYDINDEKRNVPCYPVINKENIDRYNLYLNESKQFSNLFLCGRLAEFKYYNMDLVIESTFEKYGIVKGIIEKCVK